MKKLLLAFVGMLALSATAHAQWIVNDPVNLVENAAQVEQAIQQNVQMIKDYTQMLKDYQQMVKHYKTVIGSRGMSLLNNSGFERDFIRRYMPSDFDLAMNLRYGGSTTGGTGKFQQYLNTLVQRYKLPEVGPAFERVIGASQTFKNVYDDRLRASQAVLAATKTAQLNLTSRLGAIEGILDSSESGGSGDETNDLKRAVDLNTRMVAENAFLQAELIRLMSQNVSLKGLNDQEDLARQADRQSLINYETH